MLFHCFSIVFLAASTASSAPEDAPRIDEHTQIEPEANWFDLQNNGLGPSVHE